jgi:hypothetical protein
MCGSIVFLLDPSLEKELYRRFSRFSPRSCVEGYPLFRSFRRFTLSCITAHLWRFTVYARFFLFIIMLFNSCFFIKDDLLSFSFCLFINHITWVWMIVPARIWCYLMINLLLLHYFIILCAEIAQSVTQFPPFSSELSHIFQSIDSIWIQILEVSNWLRLSFNLSFLISLRMFGIFLRYLHQYIHWKYTVF